MITSIERFLAIQHLIKYEPRNSRSTLNRVSFQAYFTWALILIWITLYIHGKRPSFTVLSQEGATPLSMTVSAVDLAFSRSRLWTRQHVWSARKKSLEILRHSRKMNPGHRENRQWGSFILPLSYRDWPDKQGKHLLIWNHHSSECHIGLACTGVD